MAPTPEKQAQFLALLREGRTVEGAARAVAIHRSTLYRFRDRSEEFKREWDEAWEAGIEALEDELRRRGFEGVEKPVFHGGVVVGSVREFDSQPGGEMVSATIHAVDPKVPVTLVRATRGKYVRAEPAAALYDQNLVHHVGMFPELEDQLVTFVPGEASPDRLLRDAADALVWAITALVPDPADLARPNAWAIGNEGLGLAVAPHLYTDY